MKYSEIADLTTKEIKDILTEETMNYSRMKMAHAVSHLENPMKIKNSRRLIAKLKTELRKRELSQKQN